MHNKNSKITFIVHALKLGNGAYKKQIYHIS